MERDEKYAHIKEVFGKHRGRLIANAFTPTEISNIYNRLAQANGISANNKEYLQRKKNEAERRIDSRITSGNNTRPNPGGYSYAGY
jgi:hypothetical protein